MCYDHSAGYFHTFEVAVAAPECGLPASDLTTSRLVGLNFSDAKEAQTFGMHVFPSIFRSLNYLNSNNNACCRRSSFR
jgi:hypothetical protein